MLEGRTAEPGMVRAWSVVQATACRLDNMHMQKEALRHDIGTLGTMNAVVRGA